jgi:hypothetical protein
MELSHEAQEVESILIFFQKGALLRFFSAACRVLSASPLGVRKSYAFPQAVFIGGYAAR